MNNNKQQRKHTKGNTRPRRSNRAGGSRDVIPREKQRVTTTVSEPWTPLFKNKVTKSLRYSTSVSLGAASGAVSTWVFSANGLFDPDITSTGHQPMGFDQMMVSYEHYTVLRSNIIVTFRNLATSPVTCSVSVAPDATPITVIDRILEFGMLNTRTLEAKSVSGSVETLETRCDIGKVNGVRNPIDVSILRGDAATNPTEQTYYMIQCWDAAALATTSVVADVIVEFVASFSEPRQLTQSQATILRVAGFFKPECKT